MANQLSSRESRSNLILLVVSLALCLAIVWTARALIPSRSNRVAELDPSDREAVRTLIDETVPGIYRPVPDSDIGYLLQPNIQKEAYRTFIQSNMAGLRGATIEEKGEGTKRIVCLGDSIAFGYGVLEGEAFPARLATLIRAASQEGAPEVEVLNCGLPGWNAKAEAGWLEAKLSFLKPDFVIWQTHDNDCLPIPGISEGGTLTSLFSSQERTLGSALFSFFPSVLTENVQRRLREVAADYRRVTTLLEREGIGFLFYCVSVSEPTLANYLRTLSESAPQARAILHPPSYLEGDYRLDWDPHPSPKGHQTIAAALAWAIREEFQLDDARLPELPPGFETDTTFGSLVRDFDWEDLQREAWAVVPTVFDPKNTNSLRYSSGVRSNGWVEPECEFALRAENESWERVVIHGILPGAPQLLPMTLLFEVGENTEELVLESAGPIEVSLPKPRGMPGPETQFDGVVVRCKADRFCSTLTNHDRNSWVILKAETAP